MTIKMTNPTNSVLLSNIYKGDLLKGLSISAFQSVDELMCKFTGRSSMKQFMKNKLVKWGFKYLYGCDSGTGYDYQLELYQG